LRPPGNADDSCVLYTPVYARSPGTRYRIDLLLESLHDFNLYPRLIVDENENLLKQSYERFPSSLLSNRLAWDMIGRRIARNVSVYAPRIAIVMLDVSAGAAKFLHRRGTRTVVFVEDLTASYQDGIRANKRKAKQVMRILRDELTHSDLVATPSYVLSRVLTEEYGVNALTVPIGTKQYISLERAFERGSNVALHAGQIQDSRQAIALTRISRDLAKDNISVLAYEAGKYARFVSGVRWYSRASPEEAIPYVQEAFLGIVARFKPAFTLSSLYFHVGLLQPILAVGDGPWMEEAELLDASVVKDIGMMDSADVRKQASTARRLAVPDVHKSFVDALRKF